MDYIEELKNIKAEISAIKGTHPKAPLYKLLAYKEVLDDFVEKEYKKYYYEVVGTADEDIPDLKPIKVNDRLRLQAMVDFGKIDYKTRKKCLYLSKDLKKNQNKIKDLLNTNQTIKQYSSIITTAKDKK